MLKRVKIFKIIKKKSLIFFIYENNFNKKLDFLKVFLMNNVNLSVGLDIIEIISIEFVKNVNRDV
jgi:hypothetical protein